MKIEPRQAAAFLRQPPNAYRAVLLYGEDEELIRERGAILTQQVAGSLTDPFRVVELDRGGWPRLADEISALAMTGGRRAIRVRNATDAIVDMLRMALKTAGDSLIVLEAPELGRGKLRSLMEAGSDTASLACYPEEGAVLHDTIRRALSDRGVSSDGEAVAWLAGALGGNRANLLGEIEKLCLFVGIGGKIDIAVARQCSGDSASLSADAGLLAATSGDGEACDQALDRAMAEGLAGVALIRMAGQHLQKLHACRLRMAGGMTAQEAIRTLRPPVFFKLLPIMTASVSLWPLDTIDRAMAEMRAVEIACKQTGARPELLARRFVSNLAVQSRVRAR